MVHVLSVVGARPQFIKAFAVSRALGAEHSECLVHTGQHYDHNLSAVFFKELGLPKPEYHLGVGSGSHGEQTARIMDAFEPVLEREHPDAVIVYGDTNSTLGAAIVTAKSESLLAHVEAGLRSHNREMPEEHNRVLTDHASDILLAPTEEAVSNLEREGLGDRTHLTGDVMLDTLLWARDRAHEATDILTRLGLEEQAYLLLTLHRAANTDQPDRLRTILDTMLQRPERVVFPAHPRTRDAMQRLGLIEEVEQHLTLLEPLSYLEFIHLLDRASRVITDSGGVQKEAFILDTPCITVRGETEWPETVTAGWNRLTDADSDRINQAIDHSFDLVLATKPQPFGDGTAAISIVDIIHDAVSWQIDSIKHR